MKKAFSRGALILIKMDRKEFLGPINADIVKKYYAWDDKGSDMSKLKTWKGGSSKQKRRKKNRKKEKKVKGGNLKGQFKLKKMKKKKYKSSWKPEKGDLTTNEDTWIENPKRRSRRTEIWSRASKEWNSFVTKLRRLVEKQNLTYAQKGPRTLAKWLFRDRTYSLLA